MKYDAGDKIIIRRDLQLEKRYGKLTWYRTMKMNLQGMILTIERIEEGGYVLNNGLIVNDRMIDHQETAVLQGRDELEWVPLVGVVERSKGGRE